MVILDSLQARRIRDRVGEDRLIWDLKPKGTFSIKEAYDTLGGFNWSSLDSMWKNLWEPNLWPKVSTFVWLIFKQIILTG